MCSWVHTTFSGFCFVFSFSRQCLSLEPGLSWDSTPLCRQGCPGLCLLSARTIRPARRSHVSTEFYLCSLHFIHCTVSWYHVYALLLRVWQCPQVTLLGLLAVEFFGAGMYMFLSTLSVSEFVRDMQSLISSILFFF